MLVVDQERGLADLLSRDLDATRAFEAGEFVRLSRGRPLVLTGAGGLGRLTLAGLRTRGLEPLAFADNSSTRQGTLVDGVEVLSPRDAAERFGSKAAFVVTIWGANSPHRFAHTREQLQKLGCDVVCAFPPLFWRYPETFLPYYLQELPSRVIEARNDVQRGFSLWEDDASREEYVAQVRLRLDADFDGLGHPVNHAQYFPDDLFSWREDEWIVDGGAYDGDTIRVLTGDLGRPFRHVLSIEPDPANFARLQQTVAALPAAMRRKIACHQIALDSRRTTLHLAATGTAASTTTLVPAMDTVSVTAVPLDSMLGSDSPTLIKLDIEGAEPEALKGARAIIERDGPILAVCVYHRQDHLWSIPLMLSEWRDDYAFFLRAHNEEGWDLVCYAIPRARLSGNAS